MAPLDSKRYGFPLQIRAQRDCKPGWRVPPTRDGGRHHKLSDGHGKQPFRHCTTHCHCRNTHNEACDGEREARCFPPKNAPDRASKEGATEPPLEEDTEPDQEPARDLDPETQQEPEPVHPLWLRQNNWIRQSINFGRAALDTGTTVPSVPSQQPATSTRPPRGILRAGRKQHSETEGMNQL